MSEVQSEQLPRLLIALLLSEFLLLQDVLCQSMSLCLGVDTRVDSRVVGVVQTLLAGLCNDGLKASKHAGVQARVLGLNLEELDVLEQVLHSHQEDA